ncbi:MAG: type II toxin-antitoxin system prevent-host-death family antitoxin [Acidobacteria bacterium]|nr:MAG: type II toxin-antitoxin system prevent-host-death family antitoxin [Acidobacteriota bacterium]
MKNTVGSYQAKTHLPRLLERAARGERITITKHGVPIAMLVPVEDRPKADIRSVIEELKKFRRGHKLGKLTIREMIEEGRKY